MSRARFLSWAGAPVLIALLGEEPFIGPYIQALRHDSVVIMWESLASSAGVVELGEGETFTMKATEPSERTIHEVAVNGLRADTRYTYRVKWDGRTSDPSTFRTLPPEGSRRLRLAAYGDSRSNPPVHAEIARRMLAHDPDIVINTGDLVTDGTNENHWKPQFFDPLRELAARISVVTCMGNHEKDAGLYYQYFHYPNNEAWFSYRWANVHFIVLDSEKPYDPGTPQHTWLVEELGTPAADWRVVFFHRPMFSAHPTREVNTNRWAWQDLFDRGGVDLALTGHDHYYHRTHRIGRAWDASSRGVYHITTAGGGAPLYQLKEEVYTAVAQSVHHYMILEFDGRRLDGSVHGLDGSLIDRFVIDRRTPEKTPFVSYEMVLWERELKTAIAHLPRDESVPPEGDITRRFVLPSVFEAPIEVSWKWTGGSSFWLSGFSDGVAELRDRKSFEVSIVGEGSRRAMYPFPRLELRPVKGIPEEKPVVNRVIVLDPIRIQPNRSVAAPRLRGEIRVDGRLDEPAWEEAPRLEGFTRGDGRIHSGREWMRIGYDEKGLLLAANVRILSLKREGMLEKRDAKDLPFKGEAVAIVLTAPTSIPFTCLFAGNARGTRFDALDGSSFWDPRWEFAAAEVPGGWQAEARIPWADLWLKGPATAPWKVNFFRWDSAEEALCEWAPTYSEKGKSREHDAELSFSE